MTKLAEKFTEYILRRNSWVDTGAYSDMVRILNDISDFKGEVIKAVNGTEHIRVDTGAVPISGSVLVNVAWPVGFKDTNYTVIATMEDTTGFLEARSIRNKAAGSVDVLVANNDGGAVHSGTLHMVGIYA